ncbi:MAG: hypothetical protein BGO55_11935 [Sphingobacteriales bacterium 50-39]|nr:MAG: hypothetical protein BGO55_11935 [Sphingobacteriales bacterium 50-39]
MKTIVQLKIVNMKKLFLFLFIAAGIIVMACNKTTTLPAYTPSIAFTVASKMSHAKDTVSSKGDTLWMTASGTINDTSGKYAISANLKTADSVNRTPYAILNIKKIPVTFTNAAPDASGMYKWSATMALPFPAVATKTKLYTTATFAFGQFGSAQMGNTASTDSKYTYAK